MNTWNFCRLASKCEDLLGLRVRQVYDSAEIKSALEDISKPYLSPLLDPDHNDFTPANSFWVVADGDNGPEMVVGVRLDDLSSMDVVSFWTRFLGRAFGDPPIPINSGFPLDVLTGRVAYMGDLLSNGGRGVSKVGRQRVRLFTAILHHLVQLEFQPDSSYCFVRDADAVRGTPFNYGFTELHPFMYEWKSPPVPAGSPGMVAVQPSKKFPAYMASIARFTEELLQQTE